MRRKEYKVGDRIFYETYPDKEVCTDTIKRVKNDFYLSDNGKEIPFKWLVLWEDGSCSSGIEDYNCLPDNDPRVKELTKKFKDFDKNKEDILNSIYEMVYQYDKLAQIELIDLLKIKFNIK